MSVTTNKLGITPGDWAVHASWKRYVVLASDRHKPIGGSIDPLIDSRFAQPFIEVKCDTNDYDHSRFPHRFTALRIEECNANALLVAEAGTVANETGLTPRQLESQLTAARQAQQEAERLLQQQRERTRAAERMEDHVKQARRNLRTAYAKLEDRFNALTAENARLWEILKLCEKWIANSIPTCEIDGPKPLPVIVELLSTHPTAKQETLNPTTCPTCGGVWGGIAGPVEQEPFSIEED